MSASTRRILVPLQRLPGRRERLVRDLKAMIDAACADPLDPLSLVYLRTARRIALALETAMLPVDQPVDRYATDDRPRECEDEPLYCEMCGRQTLADHAVEMTAANGQRVMACQRCADAGEYRPARAVHYLVWIPGADGYLGQNEQQVTTQERGARFGTADAALAHLRAGGWTESQDQHVQDAACVVGVFSDGKDQVIKF